MGLDDLQNLLGGTVDIQCDHINAGGKYILYGGLAKVEGRLYQFAFIRFKTAFFLDGFDDLMKLFFGHGGGIFRTEDAGHQIADRVEEEGDRGQHLHQQVHGIGECQGKGFALFAGQALGKHFDKQKDKNRRSDGHDGNRTGTPQAGGQYGGQRRKTDMGDIGADQHGDEGTVEVIGNAHGTLGALVAIVGILFDADLVHRRIGRFRCGKIAAGKTQKDQ